MDSGNDSSPRKREAIAWSSAEKVVRCHMESQIDDPTDTWCKRNVIITTSFWRNYDVIILRRVSAGNELNVNATSLKITCP